jgi:hypothetical protein
LDKLASNKQLIPLYSFNENHSIDESVFTDKFAFVYINDEAKHACTIAFIVLTILFVIFGAVTMIFYYVKIRP